MREIEFKSHQFFDSDTVKEYHSEYQKKDELFDDYKNGKVTKKLKKQKTKKSYR